MVATRAVHTSLEDTNKNIGLAGVARDTLADGDQGGSEPHPLSPGYSQTPRLEPGGSRASSLADGLPEPLGAGQPSPVVASRRARPATVRAGVTASAGPPRQRQRHQELLGPSRPAPTKIWKRRWVKVLVVGDSGLGKTTLISSLLNTAQELVQVHDGTGTSLAQFRSDPDSLTTTISWKDEESREVWMLRVQDTPGYGDWMNIQCHIDMIKDYVETQNKKWLDMELVDMAEMDDPRVDVCLYCLPPHRLRPNDVRYMAQLGKVVPIIPVVLKSDTMTISEAQRFRQEVAANIKNPTTRGVKQGIRTFAFSPQSVERAGLEPGSPVCPYPLVVIASNDINQAMLRGEQPVFWPQRAYKWGTAEAFNSSHSDLLALRALLLSEGLEEMVASKKQRYEGWRRAALRVPFFRRLRRRAARLALLTLLPAAAFAFAAAHEFDARKIRDAVDRARKDVFKGAASGAASAAAAVEPLLLVAAEKGQQDGALVELPVAAAPAVTAPAAAAPVMAAPVAPGSMQKQQGQGPLQEQQQLRREEQQQHKKGWW